MISICTVGENLPFYDRPACTLLAAPLREEKSLL